MKRALVTGASGFVGRHCLPELLARGFEVHAISRGHPLEDVSGEVTWHTLDLLEPGQSQALLARVRPTHLLHLAWEATPGKYWTSLDNLRWVQASLDLLTAFAGQEGERVVVAGTCAEYDWRFGWCCEHTTPLAPATLYGVCKHALGQIVESYAARQGLSAARGRLFFLYGPYEHPRRLVPSLIRPLLVGEPANCTHGRQIRDFLFVVDAAAALVALLDSKLTGAVNIASGEAFALKDLAAVLATRLGRPDLLRPGAVPAPPDEPPVLLANTARLKDELSWSARHTLDESLRQTVEWWRARLVAGGP